MKSIIWTLTTLTLTLLLHLSQSENIFDNIISKENIEQYGLALEAVFGIGIRLQALIGESTPSNFVVSPISATVIVGQLLLGAKGKFRDQIFDLLSLRGQTENYNIYYYNKNKKNETDVLPYGNVHLQLSSLLKKLQKRQEGEQYTLRQSSALFYSQDIELKRNFVTHLRRFYDSEITPLDFTKDTSSIINNWASTQTNGLINNIFPGPLDPSTSSVFLNSIYFKAQWETPFSDMLNSEDPFYTNENTTVISMYMAGLIEEIPYAEGKGYRMVCLPYKNKELGMYILLPNLDNPNVYNPKEFISQLDPAEILRTIVKAPLRDVVVKIPKLSLSNSLRLLEPLQKYTQFKKQVAKQMRNVNGTAINIVHKLSEKVEEFKNFTTDVTTDIYLTNAAKNQKLLVSEIVQEVVLSINEEGTEAAAITAGLTDYMGGSKTMVLNRPFTFFIRHEPTLATLFWGSIANPAQS